MKRRTPETSLQASVVQLLRFTHRPGVSDLDQAIAKLQQELPGWWWRVGECSVSCDASIAPDIAGPDAHLLKERLFDEGFHADLRQPSTVALALLDVIAQARAAKHLREDTVNLEAVGITSARGKNLQSLPREGREQP